MRFCLSLFGPTLQKIKEEILQSSMADLLEFRFDAFDDDIDLSELKKVIDELKVATLFKLPAQPCDEKKIERIMALGPALVDLEWDLPKAFVKRLRASFPSVKFLISYHDFSKTPEDLESILQKMKEHLGDLYKIACQANSSIDALRMLQFVQNKKNLLAISMGEKGNVARILAKRFNQPWVYCARGENSLGQLTIEEMKSYNVDVMNEKTALYGLIGGSVSQSLSHFTHNRWMRESQINAVYVKMSVEESELKEFLARAKEIGFQGLSVTMPLKEVVMSFVDEIDEKAEKIGAINTLVFKNGKIKGFNTDATGALDAVEKRVKVFEKKVAILGAGGAARAIAFEAKARGAHVFIYNRTSRRAEKLAREFELKSGSLDELEPTYDILINATKVEMPISQDQLRKESCVMDIKTRPRYSELLKVAKAKGCQLVFGYEMFIYQALEQFRLWFGQGRGSEILEDELKRRL